MLLEVIIVAIIVGLVSGGRLPRLNDLELRGSGLIFIALVTQLGLPTAGRLRPEAAPAILVASFALLLLALLLNEKTTPIVVMTTGVFLNLVVIAANRGMPVKAAALPAAAADLIHIPISEATRLPWLGDIITWPLPGAFSGLVSPGDIFLSAGVFMLIYSGMMYKGKRRQHPVGRRAA